MKAGKLDRRITIQSRSNSIGASGFRSPSWSTHLTVWANFLQRAGKESTTDDNRTTSRTVEFKTRYFSTITNEMRILYDSNYYKIEDIKEIQRQEGLIIYCTRLTQT